MDQRARVKRRKEKGVGSFIGKDEEKKTEKLWERESSRLTRWKESG